MSSTASHTGFFALTVNEIIERYPATLAAFGALGIDSCCGGAKTLGTVVDRHGLDAEVVLDTLAQAIGGSNASRQVF